MDERRPQPAQGPPVAARRRSTVAGALSRPFRSASGRWRPWLVGLYLAVNGIVLWNAVLHHPGVGYDAYAHLDYVATLAAGRLPTADDTRQFFAAPLPYLVPAALHAAGVPLGVAAKAGQLVAVPVSLALTFLVVELGRRLRPGSAFLGGASLLLLGMLPVYYKSFAMLRGEPYVALFTLLAVLLALVASAPAGARVPFPPSARRSACWRSRDSGAWSSCPGSRPTSRR